ncbi:SH3 domain-containing protein [Halomonas sp. THAF12]|uniref:SH3 domain-containing protein n=1 Tax=Halomonas sp. B23F22_10 TaxID=3459515 RepID=UPI00373F9FB1
MISRRVVMPLTLSMALMMPALASANEASGVPAAPEEGGPRNWQVKEVTGGLNLREAPSLSAAIVDRYAAGTLLDNLGCQAAEGRTWCDVQQLGGGPRGYVAASFLTPAISPDGTPASGPDDSALRAGQGEFDATGSLPCSMVGGQPTMRCEFGVARSGGGYATVVIDKPDGMSRSVYFRMGRAIGAGTSEADPGEFRAERIDDLTVIHVGEERYEIPDAVVLGG